MNFKRAFSLMELSITILIIGIVIASIVKASKLVSEFKLFAAQEISRKSSAKKITDASLWLDSSSFDSLDIRNLEDKSLIDSWVDISGSRPNSKILKMEQGDDNSKPELRLNGINGLPSLYFDGSDFMYVSGETILGSELIGSNQVTIFIVMKYQGGSTETFVWYYGSSRLLAHTPWQNNSIYFDFGLCCNANARTAFGAPADFANNDKILTFLKEPNSGSVRIDGKTYAVNNAMNASLDTSLSNNFRIGNGLNGYISEIIIFKRALSAVEIKKVENYLSEKWDIKLQN